jgi:ankyrin repeat protein/beta-lactamase regulating signal transducer with metallopeptidase domain
MQLASASPLNGVGSRNEPGDKSLPSKKPLLSNDVKNFQVVERSKLFSKSQLIKTINGLGLIWICGGCCFLFRLYYGLYKLAGFRNSLVRIKDEEIDRIRGRIQQTFAKEKIPGIYRSPVVTSPVTIGINNPCIILPENLYQRINEDELKSILFHEISHIFHKDPLFGLVQKCVIALNWWNPLVYLVSKEFSMAREYISDNYAIAQNNPKKYARCLLNLAKKTNLIYNLPGTIGMATPYITLEERIRSIISQERIMKTKLRKSMALLLILGALTLTIFIKGYNWTFAAAAKVNINNTNEGEVGREAAIASKTTNSNIDIHQAIKDNDLSTVQLILEKNPRLINKKNRNGLTPLFWALDLGKKKIAKLLINQGSDLNIKGYRNRSLLHMAVRCGDVELASMLVDKGLDVNDKDVKLVTPLHLACLNSRDSKPEMVRLLIDQGADVNVKDSKGETPLVTALYRGFREAAKLLIENGADVNAQAYKRRFLVKRVSDDNYKIEVDRRVVYTFDPQLINKKLSKEEIKEILPLLLALSKDNKELYDYVLKGNAIDSEVLSKIPSLNPPNYRDGKWLGVWIHNGKVKYTLDKKQINPNFLKDLLDRLEEYNENLLITAIIKGYNEIVKLMVRKGAETDGVDRKGKTPLQYAQRYNRQEIIKLLSSNPNN